MKKSIAWIMVALVLSMTAVAVTVNVLGRGFRLDEITPRYDSVDYIAGMSATASPRFPDVQYNYYVGRRGVSASGRVIIQGTIDGTGQRVRVTVDKIALKEVLQNDAGRFYSDNTARMYFSPTKVTLTEEECNARYNASCYARPDGLAGCECSIAKLMTDSVRIDWNRNSNTVNIAGGEDTDYPFRVTGLQVKYRYR